MRAAVTERNPECQAQEYQAWFHAAFNVWIMSVTIMAPLLIFLLLAAVAGLPGTIKIGEFSVVCFALRILISQRHDYVPTYGNTGNKQSVRNLKMMHLLSFAKNLTEICGR